MQIYKIATTVDITQTHVRHKTDEPDWYVKRNQQRNFDTVMQVLGLRCQPMFVDLDIYPMGVIPWLDDQLPKVWVLTIEVDRTDVLGPMGELFLEDIKGVPIMTGLTETTPSFPQQFMTGGPLKNIMIYSADPLK